MNSSSDKPLAELCEEILELISAQGDRIDNRFNDTDESLQAMGLVIQTVKTLMDSGHLLVKADLSEQKRELAATKSAIHQLATNQRIIIQSLSMLEKRIARL